MNKYSLSWRHFQSSRKQQMSELADDFVDGIVACAIWVGVLAWLVWEKFSM